MPASAPTCRARSKRGVRSQTRAEAIAEVIHAAAAVSNLGVFLAFALGHEAIGSRSSPCAGLDKTSTRHTGFHNAQEAWTMDKKRGSREEDAWLSDAQLARCARADEADPQ